MSDIGVKQVEMNKDNLVDDKKSNKSGAVRSNYQYTQELFALLAFVTLSIIMFVYHELWYDEIQAWMVASDASVGEMIWMLPHYEGHPPFWTLILSLFAKTGVPMEIGLRIPTLLFSSIAAALIIFKAPFHKLVRCAIPFSYFLFYQYTVICRPYSMMMLGFVLAALFYKERNIKPIRYLLSLYLLCMSSAYGILLAGMLCIVWTIEIVNELKGKEFIKKAIRDTRTWALFSMLILALLLLAVIWPSDSAFAQVRVVDFSVLKCLIYTFLMLPADALLTDVAFLGRLQQQFDAIVQVDNVTGVCILISLIIYFVIILVTHIFKKKRLFIVPYIAFASYAALGYFYNHHMGIVPLFVLFVMWCCFADKPEGVKMPQFLLKLEQQSTGIIKKLGCFFVILTIGMSLFWTVMAVKNDIQLSVWYAKDLAAVIDKYDLNQYKVVTQWTYEKKDNLNEEANITEVENDLIQKTEDGYVITTDIPQLSAADYHQYVKMCNFVDILAYSEENENYISNFNAGDDAKRYVDHDMLSQEESLKYLEELGAQGYPEVIIGEPEILGMMGLDVNEYTYIPVYCYICYRINKYNALYSRSFVYVRADIYATREDWPIYSQIAGGFVE